MSARAVSGRNAAFPHSARVGPCQAIPACHAVRVMRVEIPLRAIRVACHACHVMFVYI